MAKLSGRTNIFRIICRKLAQNLASFSVFCFAVSLFSSSFLSPTFAVDYSITMTTSGSVNLSAEAGNAAIDSSDINVITNCKAGYDLTLSTSVNDNNLYLNGDSANNTVNTFILPSSGSTILKNSPNTWGYSLSVPSAVNPSEFVAPTENNIFYPVPSSSASPAILKNTTSTASETDINDNFKVYYGVYANTTLPAGTYRLINDTTTTPTAPGALSYYLTASPMCISSVDVSFNKNLDGEGGESDPGETVSNFPTSEENIIDTTNQTITLSDKRPTRTGYQFKEWNTAADGTGNYYYPSDTVPIATTTETGAHGAPLQGLVTLYAIWVEDCSSATICYDGNHAEAGTMNPQSINAGATTNLIASNFSRSGYGFTGWNTEADGTGTQYGPNQNFTMPSSGGVNLYAQWLAPSGTLQSFSSSNIASNMNTGDVLALEDDRDGEVYMVAKLADGNI